MYGGAEATGWEGAYTCPTCAEAQRAAQEATGQKQVAEVAAPSAPTRSEAPSTPPPAPAGKQAAASQPAARAQEEARRARLEAAAAAELKRFLALAPAQATSTIERLEEQATMYLESGAQNEDRRLRAEAILLAIQRYREQMANTLPAQEG